MSSFLTNLLFMAGLASKAVALDAAASPGRAEPSLREVFAPYFEIGFSSGLPSPERVALLRHHAATVTCENFLKPQLLRPDPDTWNWKPADDWLEIVESIGARPVGHTLQWCYNVPEWIVKRIEDGTLSKTDALAWQREHIQTVLKRYGNRINVWDVANEALSDAAPTESPDADPLLRRDPWSDLCGVDYLVEAFRTAREAAPDAILLYNDYNLEMPAKRKRLFRLLQILEDAGCPPDAIGIQGHYSLPTASFENLEAAIKEIHAAGYPVHITELDVSIYKGPAGADLQGGGNQGARPPDPVFETLPDNLQKQLADYYRTLFTIFLRHSDKIGRVSFWNIDDGQTWLRNWPVKGRPNHPLLFDASQNPKPAFHAVVDLVPPGAHSNP